METMKKISLDIDLPIYMQIKQDCLKKQTTMAFAIREVLKQKWNEKESEVHR
jgi:hypothetical protein